jgi:hypothetical protein
MNKNVYFIILFWILFFAGIVNLLAHNIFFGVLFLILNLWTHAFRIKNYKRVIDYSKL